MAPYTASCTPHWLGSIAINPNDPDEILFGTGYGIWASLNATQADSGKRVTWVFRDEGLEETVPLALISPPVGPHLISGVGDIDGFRHEDLDASPAGGMFAAPPRFGNTEDLAFAGKRPEIIARTGTGGRNVSVHAAISEDSGATWNTLASDPPGGNSGAGTIALSADGRVIVWTPRRGSAHVTSDRGVTWTQCQGLGTGARVIADPVNPACFYSFDVREGKVLFSTNAGETFTATAPTLPTEQARYTSGMLTTTPDTQGDLWVGSRNGGLHRSTDSGNTFNAVNGVDGVEALGFGKAAPGKSFPALYLLGTIGGLQAYFRSDDTGQTWVRINDDQHQFAAANRPLVIGDPRIYGRVYLTTGGRGILYGDRAKTTSNASQ